MDYKAPVTDKIEEVKTKLAEIDAKVDKAVGYDVKPVHYVMIALILVGIISNWVS